MRQSDQSIIVIIGGGLAGLTAATLLAQAGCSVQLYERSTHLGGRALTQNKEGFQFNLGPHALYKQGAAYTIFQELGIHFTGNTPQSTGYKAIYKDRLSPLPMGVWGLLTSPILTQRGKFQLLQLFSKLPKMSVEGLHNITVSDWLKQQCPEPSAQQMMKAFIRLGSYTNAPTIQSAASAISQIQLGYGGVDYLDRGWQTLVDGLHQTAITAGAKIITGQRIQTIKQDGKGTVSGVQMADGVCIPTKTVIVTTSPAITAELLPHQQSTLQWWATQAKSVPAACLNIGLRQLPQPDNIFVLGIDTPLYYAVHSAYADLAPQDGATIQLAKYLDPTKPSQAKNDRAELENLLTILQPGWRQHLVTAQFLPHLQVSTMAVEAAYGGRPGRPTPLVSDIPGLYLAGDWVGNEGVLVDAAVASAKEAAKLALAHHQTTYQLKPNNLAVAVV